MIKVTSEVNIYSNDCDIKHDFGPLEVCSHWNRSEMVILKFGKLEIIVLANDLIEAIKNAKNINKF